MQALTKSLDKDAVLPSASICVGTVVHKRITPIAHRLKYRVFSLLIDCDKIDDIADGLLLFSRNRWNILSLFDKDYGEGAGLAPSNFARSMIAVKFPDLQITSVFMLTYPRFLGYAFNPLTVYYCYDECFDLRAMIFEVRNTFGQHTHYLSRCNIEGALIQVDGAAKDMRVSPFNKCVGRYAFKAKLNLNELLVGVALFEDEKAVVNTWFHGSVEPFTNKTLLINCLKLPVFTVKVILGIHYEAIKLWMKGLKMAPPHKQSKKDQAG